MITAAPAHSAVSCASVPSTCAVCDQVYYVTFTDSDFGSNRPRPVKDISDLDFDLSLNLDLGDQNFKTGITQSFLKLQA